ncbi:MAG TPA: SMP-30/gluconolactonase/LRE family protein, partial [Gemmatimonadales bacterium]|nr:SMP-30/gluconolactonase/LRE family protein [Gemmatimonadales bacterium]
AKDGRGFISRLRADGAVDSLHFIQSGRDGVTLDAPKGLALAGDTLWVADVDQVRAFDAPTGRPLLTVDLRPQRATFLNDVALGGDGAVYVTDMAVRSGRGGKAQHPVPDRIFRIAGGRATVALTDDSLARPNGIAWDSAGGRFVVVPFGGRILHTWTPGRARADSLASGPGRFDGVEVLPGGRILVTSWADSTVYVLRGGDLRPLVRGVPSPADIGMDAGDRLLAIPLLTRDRVELWRLP